MANFMAAHLLTVALALAVSAGALDVAGGQQTLRADGGLTRNSPARALHSIVRELPPAERRLRVCNAFARSGGLELNLLRTGWRLGLLEYKQCRDFDLELREGDQVNFKSGSLDVGTFAISGLPKTSAGLLLVVQKRSPHSMGAAFKSHAFAEDGSSTAQLAVIDAFQGSLGEQVHIVSNAAVANASAAAPAEEELPLNAVVAVSPGSYRVKLGSGAAAPAFNTSFSAMAQTSYVVLRVGQSPEDGFPQEVVVFPQLLEGAAGRSTAASALAMLVTLAGALWAAVEA